MSRDDIAIVGAGPYGLSLSAHLAARGVEHRIFGRPMQFWSQIAEAASGRYLKSYCFGTDLSTPASSFSFADFSKPRGLETVEPCSIGDFADYGQWFQQNNVPWAEPVDVVHIARRAHGFRVTLANGERFVAEQVVLATGLACFEHVPLVLASLASGLITHTAKVASFSSFKGSSVAVIGAGQSALEAAALLHEAGAQPQLLVRENRILWQTRVFKTQSLWRRLRSPISGLGTGPKAWALTHFPGAMHRAPATWRIRFVKRHLPAEGAWWLRERVENRVPIQFGTTVLGSREEGGRAALHLHLAHDGNVRQKKFDHVIAGSGYRVDVERLEFLDPETRSAIHCVEGAPTLNAAFESSVPGLRFVGPASAMSFGPLFRFVVGAEYTARVVSRRVTK